MPAGPDGRSEPAAHGYTRDPAPRTHEGTSEIDLTVRSRVVAGWTVLSVEGEVDLYTAPAVRDAAVAAMESGVDHLVLDLTAVPFIDSSGLGVIVACLKRLREVGGDLALVSPPSSPPTKLLSVTGLDHAIPTHATVDAALADVH
ncbi:MAG: STAS domain-containing protein [Actinobacteria bacterium]|nr:MAG: STAS domain-containing protein [Actinomycetota bacterium]